MLHYNYSATSLSHFLSYHQLDNEQPLDAVDSANGTSGLCEDLIDQQEESRCRSSNSSPSAQHHHLHHHHHHHHHHHNKSFTIAAILGLNNNNSNNNNNQPQSEQDGGSSTDLNSVVNLSVHHQSGGNSVGGVGQSHHQQAAAAAAAVAAAERAAIISNCNRLQLPVRHSSAVGHFSVSGHGCPQRQSVRGLKHLSSSSVIQTKKSCKSKRVRTIFTPEQLERLEAEFERQQYMVGPERLYLAHTLQLTEAQVKVWFQNRRIKWRKHHLELTHQRLAVLKQQQLLLDDTQADIQDTNSSSTDT